MRSLPIVLGAIFAVLLPHKQAGSSAEESPLSSPLPLAGSLFAPSTVSTTGKLLPSVNSGPNFFWMTTNGFSLILPRHGTNQVMNLPPRSLAPGIYKTEPFTCIVVVPGSNSDDQMVIGPANPDQNMPIIPPHLRFVPLSRK